MSWYLWVGLGFVGGVAVYYVYDRYVGTVKSKIMALESRLAKLKAAL